MTTDGVVVTKFLKTFTLCVMCECVCNQVLTIYHIPQIQMDSVINITNVMIEFILPLI